MILTWACKDTERLFREGVPGPFPEDIQQRAWDRLSLLHNAVSLKTLQSVRGNDCKPMQRRKGFYSLRINDQWRIVFKWSAPNATDVEISKHYR